MDAILFCHRGAAALVGLSVRTVRRLVVAEQFPAPVKLPSMRGVCFHSADIESWLASLQRVAHAQP